MVRALLSKKLKRLGSMLEPKHGKRLLKYQHFPLNPFKKKILLKFPGKMRTNNYLPRTSYANGPEIELRLTAMKIGDLVLCGISGELFTEKFMELIRSF